MQSYIERKFVEIDVPNSSEDHEGQSFNAYTAFDTIVLLGPPGSGKTTTFQYEASCSGGTYVHAREFLTLEDKPEWHGRTLFLDGLDELRAESSTPRAILDRIRSKLFFLGNPRFRLACRALDWFGSVDRDSLKHVSKSRSVVVIRFALFSSEKVAAFIDSRIGSASRKAFLLKVNQAGLNDLLRHAQTLDMLLNAYAAHRLPSSRADLLEQITEILVQQNSMQSAVSSSQKFSKLEVLRASEKILTAHLLTGSAGVSQIAHDGNNLYPAIEDLADHGTRFDCLLASTKTRLFEMQGECLARPVHRTIAEYLAARFLGRLVNDSLPLSRILGVLRGYKGSIKGDMRGLAAWFAYHCRDARKQIIESDPLAVLFYGDVRDFPVADKRMLLSSLVEVAAWYPKFWVIAHDFSRRFGDLFDANMEPILREKIHKASATGNVDNVELHLTILALKNSDLQGQFRDDLLVFVRHANSDWYVKQMALDIVIQELHRESEMKDVLIPLLDAIHQGDIADGEHELRGTLLRELYPRTLTENEARKFVVKPVPGLLGRYWYFVNKTLPVATRSGFIGKQDNVNFRSASSSSGIQYNTHESQVKQRTKRGALTVSDVSDLDKPLTAFQSKWRNSRSELSQILSGAIASSAMLYQLSLIYYGVNSNASGRNSLSRMRYTFGHDQEFIELVFDSFRNSLKRKDIPTYLEARSLAKQRKLHYLAYPILAGMEENAKLIEDQSLSLSEKEIQLVLALYLFYPLAPVDYDNADKVPQWVLPVFNRESAVVSKHLVKTVRYSWREKVQLGVGWENLLFHTADTQAVKDSIFPLIRAFPVRSNTKRLNELSTLLQFALLQNPKETKKAVANKIQRASMNVEQRAYWVLAGMFAGLPNCVEQLKQYVALSDQRARVCCEVLHDWFCNSDTGLRFDWVVAYVSIDQIALLIEILGTQYRPMSLRDGSSDESSVYDRVSEISDEDFGLVSKLINHLSTISSEESTHLLAKLAGDERLRDWSKLLRNAANRQRLARLESMTTKLEMNKVAAFLQNGAPINQQDLATMTLGHIESLANEIRHGNLSMWKFYWNKNGPRHEHECRDHFLSLLRERLAKQSIAINAQPEGEYGDDNRADIRVSYDTFNLPIEVKKSNTPQLWTSLREQLIRKYTIDPGANGFGIYLVFWFGTQHCSARVGVKPQSVDELKELLESSLECEEYQRVFVRVVDVSRPS